METQVPENVIEVLASIREGGMTNMFDRANVMLIADVMDESAAKWLLENKNRYMEALNAMGAYISKEKE